MKHLGYYHRADRNPVHAWAYKPGKYGLFILWKREDGTVPRPTPEDMVSSADTVDALVHEREFFKPVTQGLVALIQKAVAIPDFEDAQKADRSRS